MVQAGIGAGYIQEIVTREIDDFLARHQIVATTPVTLSVRIAFNPNAMTAWFTSVMGIINSVTMLAIILAGAAVVREREHGTMDHLLVMPVSPFEIAMSKILANSLVVTVAVGLSLYFVVEKLLAVPVAGSFTLFMCGTALYLFFSTAIGIFLATIARTMPQLGLLFLLVAVPLNLLSGSNTPLESMPAFLRTIMQASPSTHYVSIAQAILYRGAGFETVWPQFLEVAVIVGIFLGLGLLRLGELAVAFGEHGSEIGDVLGLAVEVGGERQPGLFLLGLGDRRNFCGSLLALAFRRVRRCRHFDFAARRFDGSAQAWVVITREILTPRKGMALEASRAEQDLRCGGSILFQISDEQGSQSQFPHITRMTVFKNRLTRLE